jgi:hypothetical protein
MTAHTMGGAGVGMAGGAVAGAVFGPADVLTVPMGAATGYVGGAAFGRIGGMISCKSGTGSGQSGGGDTSGGAQDKKLSASEIRKVEQSTGESAHQIKTEALGTNKNIAQYDLYKDAQGNVLVKAKGGVGEAIPTGLKVK